MMEKRVGKIVEPFGAIVSKREYTLAQVLVTTGHDVVFIPVATIPTADIIFLNLEWEIKSPVGKSHRTIEDCMHRALHQSVNIILDLRFVKLPEEKCLRNIERQLKYIKQIENVLVITKKDKIIDKYCKFEIIKM